MGELMKCACALLPSMDAPLNLQVRIITLSLHVDLSNTGNGSATTGSFSGGVHRRGPAGMVLYWPRATAGESDGTFMRSFNPSRHCDSASGAVAPGLYRQRCPRGQYQWLCLASMGKHWAPHCEEQYEVIMAAFIISRVKLTFFGL